MYDKIRIICIYRIWYAVNCDIVFIIIIYSTFTFLIVNIINYNSYILNSINKLKYLFKLVLCYNMIEKNDVNTLK